MRIRILDPHWNKMEPDPGRSFLLTFTVFFDKAEFPNFLSYFFRLFLCLNFINHSEIMKFLLSLFLWVLRVKIFCFAVFRLYFPPWIRIWIQEAKILRI